MPLGGIWIIPRDVEQGWSPGRGQTRSRQRPDDVLLASRLLPGAARGNELHGHAPRHPRDSSAASPRAGGSSRRCSRTSLQRPLSYRVGTPLETELLASLPDCESVALAVAEHRPPPKRLMHGWLGEFDSGGRHRVVAGNDVVALEHQVDVGSWSGAFAM